MHLGPLVHVSSSNLKDISALRPPRGLPSWPPAQSRSGVPGREHSPLALWLSQPCLASRTSLENALTAQASRSSPDLAGTFPILQLPGELRNYIYNFFIPRNQLLKLPLYIQAPRRSRSHPHEVVLHAYSWKPIHPSILRINSQIRHEVLGHFYEKNTFEVHASSLARFLEPIHAHDRLALRSLVLKGGFYMLDCPEEDDLKIAGLLQSLNLTRLHISAVVSLCLVDGKGGFDLKTLDVDEFMMRSGMSALAQVIGLQQCSVRLEPSHMTRKTQELAPWLRRLERRLEAAMMREKTEIPVQDQPTAMDLN